MKSDAIYPKYNSYLLQFEPGVWPPDILEGGDPMFGIVINVIIATITAVVTAGCVFTMERTIIGFGKDEDQDRGKHGFFEAVMSFFTGVGPIGSMIAWGIGLATGTAYYLVSAGGPLAYGSWILALVALIAVTFLFSRLSDRLWPIVPALVSLLPIGFTLLASFEKLAELAKEPWKEVISGIPSILLVIAIGIMLISYFCYRLVDDDRKGGSDVIDKLLVGTVVLLTLIVTGSTVFSVSSNAARLVTTDAELLSNDDSDVTYAAESDDEVPEEEFWSGSHFYNADLQGGSTKNDRNFGPNPWKQGNSADYYLGNLCDRISEDPVLLAGVAITIDQTCGTNIAKQAMYRWYKSKVGKEKAADVLLKVEAMNCLDFTNRFAQVLCVDKELFDEVRNLVIARLAEAKMSIEKRRVMDQMYMEPLSLLNRPELVIYASDCGEATWCLIAELEIKNGSKGKGTLIFRIPCGYQPCDVAESFGVKAKSMPKKTVKKPSGGKGDGGSGKKKSQKKKGKGSGAKGSYNKDPNDGPSKNTESGDGPDPDTNNPSDPSHSSADTGDSSTSGSYDDCKKDQQDKADTNQNQKQGGDSSKPSTGGSGHQDNSGEKIDKSTEESGGTAAGKDSDGHVDDPS